MNIIRAFPAPGWFRPLRRSVDDVDVVRERVAKSHPQIEIIQRPSNRPFAAFGMYDPAGNYFDLSAKGLKNRDGSTKSGWEQDRVFTHFAVRALEPERLATFYREIFELDIAQDGTTYRLSDGRITFVIIPWRISISTVRHREAGLGPSGFSSRKPGAFKADLEEMTTRNPSMIRRRSVRAMRQSAARALRTHQLAISTCPTRRRAACRQRTEGRMNAARIAAARCSSHRCC